MKYLFLLPNLIVTRLQKENYYTDTDRKACLRATSGGGSIGFYWKTLKTISEAYHFDKCSKLLFSEIE